MKGIFRYGYGDLLSYSDRGEGLPILVQHGLIASIDDYHLFDRLEGSGFRVISAARPGYGESSPRVMRNMAEWGGIVALLAAELGLGRFEVLGMSSGAPYAYSIARALPEATRRVYVFSGMPALYDEGIRALWPYPSNRGSGMGELQKLARELFFSRLTREDLMRGDVRDSIRNDCFGVAQDLRLRDEDWGFELSELEVPVRMEHCRTDGELPFEPARLTSTLIPDCELKVREEGGHFSAELLDNFMREIIEENYRDQSKTGIA